MAGLGLGLGASYGAGGYSDALFQMMAERRAQELLELQKRRQDLDEQYRRDQMEQQAADRADAVSQRREAAQLIEKSRLRDDANTAVSYLPSKAELDPIKVKAWTTANPMLDPLFGNKIEMGPSAPVPGGGSLPTIKGLRRVYQGVGKETPDQEMARRLAEKEQGAAIDRETHRQNRKFDAQNPVAGSNVMMYTTTDDEGNNVVRFGRGRDLAGQEFPAGLTAQQRQQRQAFGRAEPVLNAIGELSERINTQQGVIAKISGAAEKAKAQVNLNDDISEYDALVSGFTPLVARSVGHVGVLTEQDVQSVRRLFPTPTDSKSVRDRKIARIKSIMGQIKDVGPNGDAGTATPAPANGGELVWDAAAKKWR